MTNTFGRLVIATMCTVALAAAQSPHPIPDPPPIQPFANINKPTRQTQDVNDLLHFLPEVLCSANNGYRVTKTRLLDEMGTGLSMAVQQGRRFTEAEIRTVVSELVEAMINLDITIELARADGYAPDIQTAQTEISDLRSRVDETQFEAMLTMQGVSEAGFAERISKKNMIDRWIQEHLMKNVTTTAEEVRRFYDDNPDAFRESENAPTAAFSAELSAQIRERLNKIKVGKFIRERHDQWRDDHDVKVQFEP